MPPSEWPEQVRCMYSIDDHMCVYASWVYDIHGNTCLGCSYWHRKCSEARDGPRNETIHTTCNPTGAREQVLTPIPCTKRKALPSIIITRNPVYLPSVLTVSTKGILLRSVVTSTSDLEMPTPRWTVSISMKKTAEMTISILLFQTLMKNLMETRVPASVARPSLETTRICH